MKTLLQFTKPCDVTCRKCGSDQVLHRHIQLNQEVSRDDRQENEYLGSGGTYRYLRAKKEHINHRCAKCQFDWQGDVMVEVREKEIQRLRDLAKEFGTTLRGLGL
jgi:hypothetical protein